MLSLSSAFSASARDTGFQWFRVSLSFAQNPLHKCRGRNAKALKAQGASDGKGQARLSSCLQSPRVDFERFGFLLVLCVSIDRRERVVNICGDLR
jgi:hypothetical protein